MPEDDRLLSPPPLVVPPPSQQQKRIDTHHPSTSQVETITVNDMTAATTPSPSSLTRHGVAGTDGSGTGTTGTSSKDEAAASLAFQHHKEVEGRKRSGLSIRRLQQQLSEFKFEPSAIPFPPSDDSRTSSSTNTSDDEEEEEESSGASEERREERTGDTKKPPSPTMIRSKFLNKLGISPAKDEQERHQQLATNQERRDIPVRRPAEASYEVELNDVVRQRQQEAAAAAAAAAKKHGGPFAFFKASNFLSESSSASEDEKEKDDIRVPPTAAAEPVVEEHEPTDNNVTDKKQKRTLRFAPIVKVHPIPRFTAYSKRIRETVWTSAREMEEEVARNCIEFAAEDWDFQKVLEEQDMVLYHGQLVHPVHFGT
jgi:ribosomal protein L12E/L44/L45/RPP1/RPP2